MLTNDQARKLRWLLAERALGRTGHESCVEWAVEALVDGLDTPNLRILAGLPKPLTWSEVEHYLGLALSELGVTIPPGEEAIRSYVRDVAGDMVAGIIEPFDGCSRIYHVWVRLGCYADTDLSPWLYLGDGLEPGTYRELQGADLDAAMIREARRLLDRSR